MNIIMAITVGILYSAGIYMILRRSIVKLIIGLALLAHGANLLIFTLGRLTRGHPAIIEGNEEMLIQPYADPIPQALILTAIVISFGVTAFAIVLIKKVYQATGSGDLDNLIETDKE